MSTNDLKKILQHIHTAEQIYAANDGALSAKDLEIKTALVALRLHVADQANLAAFCAMKASQIPGASTPGAATFRV